MKRFSERSGYATMSELNVTPMLDLAFTLLIIFIITTPLMENSIEVNLPSASPSTRVADPKSLKTVSVDKQGQIFLDALRVTPRELEQQLARLRQADANLAVVIRADKSIRYQELIDVFDALQRAQITRMGLQHLDENSGK